MTNNADKFKNEENWDFIIEPRVSLFHLDLKEILRYRDLLEMFVRKDVITQYKQTILGPLWYLAQPVLTTVMFMFIFGNLAGIPTDGIPQPLFYMAGILCWNYFSECLNRTSDTFLNNQHIFGKVYFARIVMPLSLTISNLVKFFIQLIIFICVYIYFIFNGTTVFPNIYVLLFPLLIVLLAGQGLAFGILISSMTTKYRDLKFLVSFGVQLWMYITPVIYPMSLMTEKYSNYSWIIAVNPVSPIIETFKYGVLGTGVFTWWGVIYSLIFTVILLYFSSLVFNKVERSFMDVI
ncbi:MAG: ABC transporter permease [Bacteroidales bacterium]|jgi:lipopolysaccharide transport system permease protein|nr:ABC transporter permease [Bacteroidales bacterium]